MRLKIIVLLLCVVTQAACTVIYEKEPLVSTLQTDSGRDVQVWSWKGNKPDKGVILFAHGFNSSPLKYETLVNYWVADGYSVHAAMHVDSEEHASKKDFPGFTNWHARIEDMQLLSDTFGQNGFIAAGHSYGALWALVAGGVEALKADNSFGSLKDERAQLVLAFSPPGAIPALVKKEGFAGLAVPALIQTGHQDVPPVGTWEVHLDAFHGAPNSGQTYALVYEEVDHYFGGAICRFDVSGPAQEEELKDAANVSLQLLNAYSGSDSPVTFELVSAVESAEVLRK